MQHKHVLLPLQAASLLLERVPLLDDGSVAKVGAFFTSHGPSGPDGLAVDQTGRVVVANPGLGVAWVLNHRGEPEVVLRSCAGASLTNVAFGGADRKTLYCTESISGSVLRAGLEQAGLPIHLGQAAASLAAERRDPTH